ncbi:hypothetical protein DMB65_12815 [Flavobacterium cheongpyeongense]|jgi:hypothetical protein|uniref:Uncharacterized protein n=1 Tax=Flavobacterium cheongpyeongense TaxID=2212651 RepID=A0A2V4BNC6_9FLAO|nr:hypothetical protein [Flavobacterium cheongpyeongense]PXY40479.1 hypothetical protein DMB65_12815 [Flavobacterium cheongpyeongense]
MEILLVLIVLFFGFFIYVIFWIFKNPLRRKTALIASGTIASLLVMYNLFFVDHSMKFIQSKVYPNLYLVENEIKDRDSLNKLIKQMVIKKMNSEFIGREEKYKSKYQYTPDSPSRTDLYYFLNFYTYFEGWGTNPFGEAGTAYFIENEEDPGGFSSEELDHYRKYKIAEFYIRFCEKDTVNYIGILKYYRNDEITKTDTIINKCGRTQIEN